MSYAQRTSVPVERSQMELERLLTQHGARSFYRGRDEGRAVVGFTLSDRNVKMELPLPELEQLGNPRGGKTAAINKLEQVHREKWRALVLTVKAKLVGVESGVETFEEAFLAHIVLPNRQTVAEHLAPYLKESYGGGKMPPLLPAGAP